MVLKYVQDKLTAWFDGRELPQIAERVSRLQELGEGLARGVFYSIHIQIVNNCLGIDFDGLAVNVILAAKQSTSRLADIIISNFYG